MTAPTAKVHPAQLAMTRRTWRRLIRELALRGHGTREAGAFLLARAGDAQRHVAAVAYYDDLDPKSLTGGITFSREGFARLDEVCRERYLAVVCDVHTHPTSWVAQSETDRTNPMVRMAGHVAVIVPNYALGRIQPHDTGVHIYEGSHRWTSRYGTDASALLALTWRSRR